MSPFNNLDFYCERTDPSFWSEPVNAISNLLFIIIGVYYLRMEKRTSFSSYLSCLSITVGVGSFLFHTFANQITMWMDILPITLVVLSFVAYSLRSIFQHNYFKIITVFIIFCLGLIFFHVNPIKVLSNSQTYIYILSWLIIFILLANSNVKKYYALASLFFSLAITSRILDLYLCDQFTIGTHFLWHTFSSIVIYYLIKTSKLLHQ
jgi:hypothetical protein